MAFDLCCVPGISITQPVETSTHGAKQVISHRCDRKRGQLSNGRTDGLDPRTAASHDVKSSGTATTLTAIPNTRLVLFPKGNIL